MIKASHIGFIGSAGIPNRYGGFESFLEHCAPYFVISGYEVTVTCDGNIYNDRASNYKGVNRKFLMTRANGGSSVIHDLLAFLAIFSNCSHIVVLGVSGGIWFPLFRFLCILFGKKLIVNIDGVEWRRAKFGFIKRGLLFIFDSLAQTFAHIVIYDNEGLRKYVLPVASSKSVCIGYSGDHVKRYTNTKINKRSALTICRIEPENNLELLINGFLASRLASYTIIGNWNHSKYASDLRKKFESNPRLRLLDPIYDADELASHRESCDIYIHGHSVGGTNPSLVEMLFYDCRILCFDVPFNRFTAINEAQYFNSVDVLASMLDEKREVIMKKNSIDRAELRKRFTAKRITEEYIQAIMSETPVRSRYGISKIS